MKPAWKISLWLGHQRVHDLAILLLTTISITVPVSAQSDDHAGYVSTGVGLAFKLNGNANPSGTQFNALEIGYELRHGLGVTGSFTVGNFNYAFGSTSFSSVYRMIVLGPMYIIHLDRRSSIDIKARVGYHYHEESGSFNDGSTSGHFTTSGAAVGFLFTGTFQYRIADRWTLFGNLDLSTNQLHFAPQSAPKLTTLGVTAGVGFRF
jgi:hypothetical protein